MGKIACILIVLAAFVLGVYVGRMPIVSLILDDASTPETPTQAVTHSPTSTPSRSPTPNGTTISPSSLSEGQKKLLSALGIDANTIVVTPAMIACAEGKVGAARVAEITAGATPSFSEGLSLLACYR